jgi:hypothetical protein
VPARWELRERSGSMHVQPKTLKIGSFLSVNEHLNRSPTHDSSVCSRLRCHSPSHIACKCPVPEPRDDRAGYLWSGIGACYPGGAVFSVPQLSAKFGTWRKYGTSSVGHIAGPFNNDAVDIGIEFEEMIANP